MNAEEASRKIYADYLAINFRAEEPFVKGATAIIQQVADDAKREVLEEAAKRYDKIELLEMDMVAHELRQMAEQIGKVGTNGQ